MMKKILLRLLGLILFIAGVVLFGASYEIVGISSIIIGVIIYPYSGRRRYSSGYDYTQDDSGGDDSDRRSGRDY
jgi:hypothetical protein